MIRRLQQLPGVVSVGLTSFLPVSGNSANTTFVTEGYVAPQGASMNLATPVAVQGDFLHGHPVAGRPLLHPDGRARHATGRDRQPQARRALLAGSDPIGKRLRIGTQEMQTPWMTIVGESCRREGGLARHPQQGTVTISRASSLRNPWAPWPHLRIPLEATEATSRYARRWSPSRWQMFCAPRFAPSILNCRLTKSKVWSRRSPTAKPRAASTQHFISAFALAAVLLAAPGIYSVIAFSAAQRAQEMAIRIALGSQRSGILGLVFTSAAKLALVAASWDCLAPLRPRICCSRFCSA